MSDFCDYSHASGRCSWVKFCGFTKMAHPDMGAVNYIHLNLGCSENSGGRTGGRREGGHGQTTTVH